MILERGEGHKIKEEMRNAMIDKYLGKKVTIGLENSTKVAVNTEIELAIL